MQVELIDRLTELLGEDARVRIKFFWIEIYL